MGEQVFQQTRQQHGVSDVGYEKFVKTEYAAFLRPANRNPRQGVPDATQIPQFVVDALHESVEMDTLFFLPRQRFEKQVHQPGLAAANAAPEIQTADRCRIALAQPAPEPRPGLLPQVLPQRLEGHHGAQLFGIASERAGIDPLPV
jgi:hypothetical protein